MKNLVKANKLIEDFAKKDTKITPIIPKDEKLFAKFFKSETYTYGNSWTYVTQGMYGIGPYGLGYKYYDGKNLSTVCIYPKIEQPNKYCFYWVRPMGPKILDIIDKYSKELLSTQSMPTYVKKIFKDQFQYLEKKGFKDTSKFPWHTSCISEDDSLPEQIINVTNTLVAAEKAKKNTKLHRAYQYYRHFIKEGNLRLGSVFSNFNTNKEILLQFFKFQKKLHKQNVSEPDDYYNLILHPSKTMKPIESLIFDYNKSCGFFYALKQNNLYVSLYATITLRELSNHLAEFIMFYLLKHLQKQRVTYLNLGGSETIALDEFKKKFLPDRQLQMYWACYY